MTVLDLKKQILSDTLDNYYIFTGNDMAFQKVYIQEIAKVKNLQIIYSDSVAEVLSKVNANALFSIDGLYVVIDDENFLTKSDFVNILTNSILICIYTKINKKSGFYKLNKDRIIIFEHLPTETLKKHLRVELSNESANRLIAMCGNDLGRIRSEEDKILNYNSEAPNKSFGELIKANAIYSEPQDVLFNWVDSLLFYDFENAFKYWEELKRKWCPVFVMLVNLYNATKKLLQVQSCESDDISKTTGLSAFEVKMTKKFIGSYSNLELIKIMQTIKFVEQGIKRGYIEESIAIDYLMTEIRMEV